MDIEKKYIHSRELLPIWSGDTVYHESVMFLGGEESAQLMYTPTEVYCVLSFDYTVEYVRGVDYEIDGDRLVRLPNSRIPYIPTEEYYPAEHRDGYDFGCTVDGHPYLMFGEGITMQQYQVVISYRHADTWDGFVPASKADGFARFIAKLERGEEVTVVFYGDSITTGCNSTVQSNHAPYTPTYPYMITTSIAEKYGYSISIDADPCMKAFDTPLSGERVLHYVNTAVGGMDSSWGLANVQERVCVYKPDLLVLAFGMNDGGKEAEHFLSLTRDTVDAVRAASPECDVCLVATMLPHWRAAGFFGHQIEYEPVLAEYAATQPYMAVAPMTSMHKSLLEKKEFYTMTGNNINHSNDFLARVYAMTVLATLGVQ